MKFAILCRVSSEEQTKGESLAVQERTLEQCVKSLGGEIVKKYLGQESATKSDRPILDELLADCSSGLFDAVMVYDSSRLDRDPVRAKISFATFKKYGIKLFIQHSQYDLNNPESSLIAALMSEISQFQVAIQTKKSVESKLELAKRGYPVSTSPHGRIQVETNRSKPARYEVIPEAKEEAEKFWDAYVNENLDLKKIAERFGTDTTYVRKTLFLYSLPEWKQTIKNQTITIQVPPLLSEEQIEKAKVIAANRKKFNSRKTHYLLGGKVKCGICNLTYSGQTAAKSAKRQRSYYVHSSQFKTDLCILSAQVKFIDTAVFYSINNLFSSIDNLKECIHQAIANNKESTTNIETQIKKQEKHLSKLDKEKTRLIDLAKKNILTDQEISQEITKIREQTIDAEHKLNDLKSRLKNSTIKVPDDLAERIHSFYQTLITEDQSIEEWSLETKKLLVDWFFSSKDSGVVLMRDPNTGIVVNVKGIFNSSYLGIIDQSIGLTQILGYKELETKPITSSVDFRRIINVLYAEGVMSKTSSS